MKKLFLFLLLFGCLDATRNGINSVAPAVTQIIRDFYSVKSDRFDLILCGGDKHILHDIVRDFGKFENGNFPPFGVIHLRQDGIIKINQSAILMFDSFDSYQDFHKRVELNSEYPKKFNLLVYVFGVRESQARSLILHWMFTTPPFIMQYESFLVHDNDYRSILLLTFVMFRQPNCRDWITHEVNRYSVATKQWSNEDFFIDKFNNFNGCTLVAFAMYPRIGLKSDPNNNNGADVNRDFAIKFNEIVADKLNISVFYQSYNWNEKIYSNKTLIQDYQLGCISLRKLQTAGVRTVWVTESFTTTDDIIVISKFKPYNQLQKLILPFDREVWHWLAATFLITTSVIVATRFTSKKIRDFIVGRTVASPMLNVL